MRRLFPLVPIPVLFVVITLCVGCAESPYVPDNSPVQAGDVVYLKGLGGPPMVVESVDRDKAVCLWWAEGWDGAGRQVRRKVRETLVLSTLKKPDKKAK
jgi:uncharacterized protein YodC (DUF2158 family)